MSDSEETDDAGATHGPIDSAKNVIESVLGLFEKRFELAATELQEEKYRLVDLLVRLAVVGVLGLMALIVMTILLIVLSWDTVARPYVIVGLALAYGISAWRCYVSLKRSVEDGPSPFSATVDELRKDREWFQRKS
jgi:uncharacterized membrane protein YqjE